MIIGITGTLGAGKTTIVEYLQKHGFKHYSVREYLIEEIKRRNMPVNRDSMVIVANDLRQKYSPSYIVEQIFLTANKAGGDCIIESIRAKGEVEALRKKGSFYLLSIDAESKIRYDRIYARKSVTDTVSYDEFKSNEAREFTSTDPNKQNLKACMELADFNLHNSGTFDELYKQIEETLCKIKIMEKNRK